MPDIPGGLTGAKSRKSRLGDGDNPALKDVININAPFSKILTVTSTGAAAGFGSVQLASLPKSELWYLRGRLYVAFQEEPSVALPTANLSDTWSGDFSIGTLKNADADLADAGDADLVASTARDVATAGGFARAAFDMTLLNNTLIDNNNGSKGVWLNLLVDALDIADNTSAQIRVSGVLRMVLFPFGKNA